MDCIKIEYLTVIAELWCCSPYNFRINLLLRLKNLKSEKTSPENAMHQLSSHCWRNHKGNPQNTVLIILFCAPLPFRDYLARTRAHTHTHTPIQKLVCWRWNFRRVRMEPLATRFPQRQCNNIKVYILHNEEAKPWERKLSHSLH